VIRRSAPYWLQSFTWMEAR